MDKKFTQGDIYEALKECMESLCSCCKRLNPQHKNCTSCEEIERYKSALNKADGVK